MTIAVIAEKPSVARDIARVVGASRAGEGSLSGNGYVVTWAIGHLVTLAEPGEMHAEWEKWRRDLLPMLPREWPLVVIDRTKEQFALVKRVLNAPDTERVVCATDAGREGELIFRFIYEAAGCRKPVQRLWISSLTPEAIREGFRNLRDGRDMNPLADAARGRSRADWLVGMNLSRAYTLAADELLSVGRVQTPTLAILVERELAIRDFVPEDYLEVVATFSPRPDAQYDGTWFKPVPRGEDASKQRRLPPDGIEANAIVARAKAGRAAIESIESETKRMPPPQLYDLNELQRHANRLFGFTAQKTLDVAQALYERHKLLSYPRTDSRHLSTAVASTLDAVVQAIRDPYEPHVAPGSGQKPLGKRFVDDTRVTDHHAIIPTTGSPEHASLSPDEKKLYDLVCRRLLMAWHADFVWDATSVVTAIRSEDIVDLYRSNGTAIQQQGWKVLDPGGEKNVPKSRKGKAETEEVPAAALPSGLERGQPQTVVDAKAVPKRTRPPPRLTDATLLTAMETAGKTLDEKELSDAMKECGLGTPATRAATIETLLQREYIARREKALEATEKGIALIATVDPDVKSPVMTGSWEARLQQIQRGRGELGAFIADIERYVTEVVGRLPRSLVVGGAPKPAREAATEGHPPPGSNRLALPAAGGPRAAPAGSRLPTPPEELGRLLKETYGFDSFRPYQEAVCRAATEGRDVLLVMQTGAGKSLCYQLPGLARAGTTLVVSPLIALMEDQVARLQSLGLRAERIHSGRNRAASRQVCRDYLDGHLDFLFIAPERLSVPGFPEMLAKRTPALIAIDEAHCISQWGHDFRPDYRLLGQRLPLLRPAPVIAVTATATPIVQKDILEQLAIQAASSFIRGFRRDNLAIEVLEAGPADRATIAARILSGEGRLPALVYAPTRKRAEEVARELAGELRIAAYHAGLPPQERDAIQSRFLAGELDVVVATIAFGMGIDKANVRTVIHLALPSSIEGYYQEIGRAGRDGLPSRVVLMHSYADRHTHAFFQERDYPEPKELERIFRLLGKEPVPKEALSARLRMDEEIFDRALEKLWIHGGAQISADELIERGRDGWQRSYIEQRERRTEQVELMARFAERHICRMLQFIRHFGDREDDGKPCGICDVCAPDGCIAAAFREPTAQELSALGQIVRALQNQDGQGTGRLARQIVGEEPDDRRLFDKLLGGLVRSGFVRLTEDEFEKDGKRIEFRRANLTPAGRRASQEALAAVQLHADAERSKRGKGKKRAKGPPKSKRKPAPQADGLTKLLKEWRLGEARRRKVPAFRILTDRTLVAIAEERPVTPAALLKISGIGPKLVEQYGRKLLDLCSKG
jgi:DNA topoisomerase-3